MGSGANASAPFCCATISYAPPHTSCSYRCPKRLHDGIIAVELLDTMGIVLRFREKLWCLNR